MFPPHCQRFFEQPQIVKVVLPLGDTPLSVNARVSLGEHPDLEAFFPPNKLPLPVIEMGKVCFIHCKSPQGPFTVSARIVDILDPRRLKFLFLESSPPVQQRQHFRIDTRIGLKYWPKTGGTPPENAVATQVNLSAGGLRLQAEKPFEAGAKFFFEIVLPEAPVAICGELQVVRMLDIAGTEYVAFNFSLISGEDRDTITSFCLAEQRRLLREKVHAVR